MCQEPLGSEKSTRPLIGAALGSYCATLPDLLEPAINPHHRQFFHSVLFAAIVAGIGWKIKEWQPEDACGDAVRFVLLMGCGAYLVHLGMDAVSKRSLPLFGKI
jgi:membrane-bound metal-dependent hydrolase YbcI (DUF457 family)